MKLEDQVCNLDLAKRLKKLGAEQEAFFSWVLVQNEDGGYQELIKTKDVTNDEPNYAAFTVAELGEMLPQGCATFRKNENVKYRCVPPRELQQHIMVDADTRAKMLIYLIENNLLSA